MRPYMLWLARVYGGWLTANTMYAKESDSLVGDWVKRQSEMRRLCDGDRLRVPSLRPGETLLLDHRSKTIEILRRERAARSALRPARGAVQGGR